MYKRSEAELDMVITKGAHFVEDDSFVESFRKKAKKREVRAEAKAGRKNPKEKNEVTARVLRNQKGKELRAQSSQSQKK